MHFSTLFVSSLAIRSGLVAASPAFLRPRSDLRGFDVSEPPSKGFWDCAVKAGYGKAVIRMYQQACGSGGKVDKNFVATYNAAVAAGFTNIDAYIFPCTGTQPTGVTCKPVQTQIKEILDILSANSIVIQNLWFDVEPTSGECNAWNLGRAANLALAEEWITAIKATGLQWGIYANGNQWEDIFPSRSSDIASDLPLWAVQEDFAPEASSVTTFMGGWTEAYAKQYNLDTQTPECGGVSLDLDSFVG